MEYGNSSIKAERLYLYQGFDPASVNLPPYNGGLEMKSMDTINQRDADIYFLWQMVTISAANTILNNFRSSSQLNYWLCFYLFLVQKIGRWNK